MATAPLSTERQFGIWRSRVFREIDKCAHVAAACPGAELYELGVDEAAGVALARFRVFVPFRAGSSALSMVPLTALEVAMPFDAQHASASFPFRAPRVTVYIGAETLPRELRRTCDATGETLLELPSLARWSPSNTLIMVLQDFVAAVQQNDPQPAATASEGGATTSDAHGKRLRMRKRDIYGAIYHCEEVDARTGLLRPVPMLLQSGNVVLLMPPPSKTAIAAARRANGGSSVPEDDPDYVYVSDLFPLKDIARITPQRGKSVTFFFKNQRTHCRTLLTAQTEAIVADIQRMIAAVGSNKRARDGGDAAETRSPRQRNPTSNGAQDEGAFSQLLSFLSPESTEKAKEMSGKIVGKLSRWGSSVSRFFKGDEDAHDGDTARTARDPAFHELDRMKSEFFRYPSRAKMVAITNRYQTLAETLAQHNSRDGQVEKAIEEMQAFIEHPSAQRLLLESYAIESADRGIRVGSL